MIYDIDESGIIRQIIHEDCFDLGLRDVDLGLYARTWPIFLNGNIYDMEKCREILDIDVWSLRHSFTNAKDQN